MQPVHQQPVHQAQAQAQVHQAQAQVQHLVGVQQQLHPSTQVGVKV